MKRKREDKDAPAPAPVLSQEDADAAKFSEKGVPSRNAVRIVLQLSSAQLEDLLRVAANWMNKKYEEQEECVVEAINHTQQKNALKRAKQLFTIYIKGHEEWGTKERFNLNSRFFDDDKIQACADWVFNKAKDGILKGTNLSHRQTQEVSPSSSTYRRSSRKFDSLDDTSVMVRTPDLSSKVALLPFSTLISDSQSSDHRAIDAHHVKVEMLFAKVGDRIGGHGFSIRIHETGEPISSDEELHSSIMTYMKGFYQDESSWLLLCVEKHNPQIHTFEKLQPPARLRLSWHTENSLHSVPLPSSQGTRGPVTPQREISQQRENVPSVSQSPADTTPRDNTIRTLAEKPRAREASGEYRALTASTPVSKLGNRRDEVERHKHGSIKDQCREENDYSRGSDTEEDDSEQELFEHQVDADADSGEDEPTDQTLGVSNSMLHDMDPSEIAEQIFLANIDKDASLRSQHNTLIQWERAALTFRMPVQKLLDQHSLPPKASRIKIGIIDELHWASDLELYAHQFVGVSELFEMMTDMNGGILADDMGMGKTLQCVCVYDLNRWLVFIEWHRKQYPDGHIQSDKEPSGASTCPSQQFFPLSCPCQPRSRWRNIIPRKGAVFVVASVTGYDAWLKAWIKVFGGSSEFNRTDGWAPKIIYQYTGAGKGAAKMIAEFDPGCKVNAQYKMNPKDWCEVFPSTSFKDVDMSDKTMNTKNAENFSGSTELWPNPTAARMMVVSTNESWPTNVWGQYIQGKNTAVQKARKELADYERKCKKTNPSKKLINKDMKGYHNLAAKIEQTIKNQEARYAQHHVAYRTVIRNGDSTTERCYRPHAGIIIIDELHDKAGEDTNTYQHVLGVIKQHRPKETHPAVIALTGTPLDGGVKLAVNFISKAIRDEEKWMANSRGSLGYLQRLAKFDRDQVVTAFDKLLMETRKHKKKGIKDLAAQLKDDTNFNGMLKIMSTILGYCVLQRDADSIDPNGNKLNIFRGKLDSRYLHIKPSANALEKIQRIENSMSSQVAEALRVWQEAGEKGLRPSANPSLWTEGYHEAQVLCTLPNIYEAIWKWQKSNPSKPKIIADEDADTNAEDCEPPWGRSLGASNEELDAEIKKGLKSKILQSIAKDAVIDSHKFAFCLKETRMLSDAYWEEKDGTKWKKKIVLMIPKRISQVIFAIALRQIFGEDAVAFVPNSEAKRTEVPIWQQKNPDACHILVGAFFAICQSCDLLESDTTILVEPNGDNAKVVQGGSRSYRIGQERDVVHFWVLVTKGAMTETRIASRNVKRTALVNQIRNAAPDKDHDDGGGKAPVDGSGQQTGGVNEFEVNYKEEF